MSYQTVIKFCNNKDNSSIYRINTVKKNKQVESKEQARIDLHHKFN